MCTKATNALMISLLVFSYSVVIMIDKNADAYVLSPLARLNNHSNHINHTLQPPQEQHFRDVSTITSSLNLHPPADFEFLYSFGIIRETNNTLSSERHAYLKENLGARTTNITFTLSPTQMQKIWVAAAETGFFQITNNFTETCDPHGNCILVTPEHFYVLKITANNTTKTVIAREAYAFQHDQEYQNFKSLVVEVHRLTIIPQEDEETVPSDQSEPKRGYL
jgi:hypothetical protein